MYAEKTPSPEEPHSSKEVLDEEAVRGTLLPAHMLMSLPALTTGRGLMVSSMASLTESAEQARLPVATSVRVALPISLSLVPGVYAGLRM